MQSTQGIHTLKMEGSIKRKRVELLIDTGSTHNFISHTLVKALRLEIVPCEPLKVMIADGLTTSCNRRVVPLLWQMAGCEFTSNFYAIPLGGYDAILGVQWLQEVSPLSFDFNRQELVIRQGEQRVTLV